MSYALATNDQTNGHLAYAAHCGIRSVEKNDIGHATVLPSLGCKHGEVELAFGEQFLDGDELTVDLVAQRLGKSSRQIQRLLQAGKLKGYKIDGPKGPQWKIRFGDIRHLIAGAESICMDPQFQDRLDDLDAMLLVVKSRFDRLKDTASLLESELARMNKQVELSGADSVFVVDQPSFGAQCSGEADSPNPGSEDRLYASRSCPDMEPQDTVSASIADEPAPQQEPQQDGSKWWQRVFNSMPAFLRLSAQKS